MRTSLLIIASLGVISSAVVIAQTPSTAASPQAGAAALDVVAMWEPRTLKSFGGDGSCDLLVDHARFMLLQLGAHDLKIDARRCLGDGGYRTVDATFWVLAPANKSDSITSGVAARWQIVEMHPGDYTVGGLRLSQIRYPNNPALVPRPGREAHLQCRVQQDRRWLARPGIGASSTISRCALDEPQWDAGKPCAR